MRISDWSSDVCSSDLAFLIGAIAIGYAIKNYGHWFEGQPTPAKTRASAMQPAVPDDDAIAAPSAISTDLNSLNARDAALAARLAALLARAATIDTTSEQSGGHAQIVRAT